MKSLNKFLTLLSLIIIFGINNVEAQCDAQFTYADNGNGNYDFTFTGTGSVWSWDLGDGNSSGQTNTNHTYTSNGSYWVRLTVSDSSCFDTINQQIIVTSVPSCNIFAGFSYVDNGNGNYTFTPTVNGGTSPYTYSWNFDGTNTNTVVSPSFTYMFNGNYNPYLIVTDFNGCVYTAFDSVTVTSVPCSVPFTTTDNGGGNYSFTSTANNTSYNEYKFGDGDSLLTVNANHTYTANGTYIVTFQSIDTTFCTSVYTDTIIVTSANSCSINANFAYVDNGNGNYTFTNTSTGHNFSSWSFGNGGSNSNSTTVNNAYLTNGTYAVVLQIGDSNGICSDTAYQTITVTSVTPCSVSANFTYIDNGNGSFTFTSSSTGGQDIYNYWYFGDGASDFSVNTDPVSHTYATSGSFNVTLTIQDSLSGCMDTVIQTINAINCNYAVTTYDTTGTRVDFYVNSPNSTIFWQFGDGATSTTIAGQFWGSESHEYPSAGTYYYCVTIDSCPPICDSIVVVGTPCNVISSFTSTDNGNGVYSFTNTSLTNATYYSWNFGDGQWSSFENPNHTYSSDGVYIVCFNLGDAQGCSDQYCDTVIVSSNNPCNIASGFTYTNNGGGNYSFTNTSTGNIVASYWNFGDGIISNLVNPNHTFLANGTFVVELISIDSTGLCVDYEIITLQVTGVSNPLACNASFIMIPDSTNSNIIIFNTSTGNNLAYFWDFGDGNTSTLAYPFYSYTTAGPFQICLTVNDGNGCSSTYCDSISSNGVVLKTGGFDINIQGPQITSVETEQLTISELNIYPNPFKNDVTIDLNLLKSTQTEIFVTD
ncbi:MAG: PKD domain-containing protein, partial [Flavobacteriales bacterium]|nr:PKD domain-containing protein [Flavobacteriales bacterium]